MDLQQALTQINDIHAQLARAQIFRGYRSLTTLMTGIVALIAGGLQYLYLPASLAHQHPSEFLYRYIFLWVSAAVFNLAIVAAEMIYRSHRARSRVQTDLTLLAIEQFMPALVAGGMLTAILVYAAPKVAFWMLPGIWQLMFALGVFASCRLLPRATFWIAGFYLLSAGAVLLLNRGELSPLLMAVPFFIGQTAAAIILYFSLERPRHG